MRFNIGSNVFRAGALCAIAFAGASAVGCANKTEGERTLERAKEVEDAGHMISRGEQLVRDGKATEARGRAAKDQGDTVEGNHLINEGQAQQKQGQALIEQGRKVKS
jgi:hypothetical protein